MSKAPRIGLLFGAGETASHDDPRLPVNWPAVDCDALAPERRDVFLRRKRGIELYLSGSTDAEIGAACGFGRCQIYRLIRERCLQQHEDGQLNGWRGALPHLRLKPWSRTSAPKSGAEGEGTSGALMWLFASPGGAALEQRLRHRILSRPAALESSRRRRLELFGWFIRELRAAGYEARGEWPFNVDRLGYVTIAAFIDKVLAENPQRQRALQGGKDAQRKARAGDGADRPHLGPVERVECDAHKLDARMVIMVPSPHGGTEPRVIHRLWVVVLIDVASRAVLGYHLSLHRECTAEDVLKAVRNALSCWRRRELRFSGSAYAAQAGFPSSHHERYVGACWDQFSVDGAMANTCERVGRQLQDVVGAAIIKPQDSSTYASRRSKDDRPFIESFFRQLSTGGFHRLSTTTGSSPRHKRGEDPDAAARATQFQLEYAEELLDTLIANYNATPHSSLGYRSPLAQLDLLCSRAARPLRYAEDIQVRGLVGLRRLCTVKGGIDSGRRPYLQFANARYSAEWLCLRMDLLGKNVWVQIENEDDARLAIVSTVQGLILGSVRAAPPWHRTPHTLYMRTAIRSLHRRRLIHLSSACDAVEELIRFSESQPGGKLPPHPAYLEARRVLQYHAEQLEETAQPRLQPPAEPAADAVEAPQSAPESPPLSTPSKLPAMQMAKVW